MASIMIGSFACPLMASAKVATGAACEESRASVGVRGAAIIIAPNIMAPIVQVARPSVTQINNYGRRLIKQAENQVEKAFENFFNKPEIKESLFKKSHAKLVRGRKQSWRLSTPTLEIAHQRQAESDRLLQEKKDFLAGKYNPEDVVGGYVFVRDQTKRGEQVSFKGPFWHRTYKNERPRTSTSNSLLRASATQIERDLLRQLHHSSTKIEYIGRRKQRLHAQYVQAENFGRYAKIRLPHEANGVRLSEKSIAPYGIQPYSAWLEQSNTLNNHDHEISYDEWHYMIRDSFNAQNTRNSSFVIRGRLNGRLVDARETLPRSAVHQIVQFSKTPEAQFFIGWKKIFDKMCPHTEDHGCSIDFTNEQCGELAALISQSVFPVKRLSCKQCRQHIRDLSWEEYKEFLLTHMGCHETIWEAIKNIDGVKHVKKLVEMSTAENASLQTSLEIVRLTQNYKSTHMLQIQDINKALMKGPSATQGELEQASKQLLAMTQWWKNHMALTNEDALKVFRNKRSSKALLNPSLLCDNQLDKNGNFVWGERAKHSKRFFSNYFEEVIPSEGYSKYVVRKNPNGQRELAIGSLIVPLDFERARMALQGKSVAREPITMACISRQDGNFVYPCCCVTHDDGKAFYSELKSPTKRHLVIGTSGDPKYIDLPAAESERMYIAKEGFCYLNIFLAMLVNVNEDEAKDFTKMVRDIIVPKPGQWPTMLDVATAVYMLTVFHPETRNAELPRILVDHACQTMHVIDSFGSLTVGYHVLKAGTVNQLIQFASSDLQSEMKFYRVGGEVQQRMKCETALITSIFKPERMIQIFENDPYILLMGLVSPSILIHMYRMKHFEKGMELWINREHSVAKIFIIMEQLTKKIAANDVLLEQLYDLMTSEKLMSILEDCPQSVHSYKTAKDLLAMYIERKASNSRLTENGFVDINDKLYIVCEKIYVDRLKQEWRALSWLEKSSVTWQLKRFTPHTEEYLTKKVAEGSSALSGNFVSTCFMSAQSYFRNVRSTFFRKCEQAWTASMRAFVRFIISTLHKCYSDIVYLVNICLIFSLLVQMASVLQGIVSTARRDKAIVHMQKRKEDEQAVVHLYEMCEKMGDKRPSTGEFLSHVKKVRPELLPVAENMVGHSEDVSVQVKTAIQLQLEKIVAFMALITMCIDNERSEAVFKVLSKLKTIFNTMGEDVKVQSLDEIQNIDEDKKLTIDFDLETSKESSSVSFDAKFEDWWHRQLQQNRVVTHYRSTGEFLEFTRETAAKVANLVATSSHTEFLIRGAVGSGKSTGLPHHLSKKGKVLLLEPTRPLAENVSKQLSLDPFYHSVTLRMRGLSKFGSSNIVVMTSGFAFHYYVNNPQQLSDFDFIIIDECHVQDSSTIAFNCALKEFEFSGKLLKVSATPPGRECEFTTQHPVKLKVEDHLSFQNFVQAQGTGSNADMIQYGNNLLVYVASYNEVDQLSRLLTERHYKVTKVDGRTMQMGNVEITTTGTEGKPHFVVATNIIENGVTLDIDCVIDFGKLVVATLDTDSRCVRYNKKSVSYGERIQRLGRVGRCKPGFALRIGHTEKGIEEVPEFVATEAAFLSFAYGLPVTTQSVSTNILSRCTVKQARVALNFELTPFLTTSFIKYDGSMHPEIHRLLKPYKLRESEMMLSKLAIPYQFVGQWLTVKEYERQGIHMNCSEKVRVPFYVHGIPDKLYEMLWETVCKYKCDAGFGSIKSVNAAKISYTLSTDPTAIPRTLAIIDHLLCEEMTKRNHFDTIGSSLTGHSFSLAGIADGFRKRYLRDYTQQNISILQHAKSQLLEFDCNKVDINNLHNVEGIGILNAVQLQSKYEVSKFLQLKESGMEKGFMNDAIVAIFALVGWWLDALGIFYKGHERAGHNSRKERQIQKLKFRDAFDRKVGREIYADDYTMEHTFGEAYTKKGKQKGSAQTKGMGRKSRNFIHMYGVEPENYSMIRFVDPLTGHTMDENPRVDIRIVQQEFDEIRQDMIKEDELDPQRVYHSPGIQAYFIGKNTEEALKVDLTPHRPTLLCQNSIAIAGFPERENELRQTGLPQVISRSDVPRAKERVEMESKSVYKGLRDYSGISTLICQLTNSSDGHKETMFGVGYGAFIITNGHLFRRNNGKLTVRTWHGEFVINNTTQLRIHFIQGKDAILIRMPKDFPPFAKRSLFRHPKREERVCMVGTNFQEKSLRATVSESSIILPEGKGSFWIHWITTQDGFCGLPLVSVSDGHIVGIHGLTSNDSEKNFFVPLTDGFEKEYLDNADNLSWDKHWFWEPSKIAWGSLNLVEEQPKEEFKISKLVTDLFRDTVAVQSRKERWVLDAMEGNLVACGQADSALVTKHVIKGRCPYFAQYLSLHHEAKIFFEPLMGAYQPSRLNKDAFKRDFFKYNKPVVLNEVDFESFEKAVMGVKKMMAKFNFKECLYVTDPDEIYGSLNMKAAVGAQYKGKKQEYFSEMDCFDKERLLYLSCERLFYGEKGIWNGSLKAELRPIEKVQANKTRTFTAAPIDTLLGAKVCVDDFNNQFYSFNLICPWTVGMTKFYGGWNKLMRSLPDGWVYCHADGSQFDSSLTPLLLNAVLDVRRAFMEDWWVGKEMLDNLYAEIVYTPILTPDGTIFKKFRGNNSGQPSTVVDNTLMVVIAMYYSCCKQGWSEEEIQEKLVFSANGDDIILAVNDKDTWLYDTLSTSFAELGLNYNFDEQTRKREELWFMSHKAILIDGVYVPKLEPERIVSILEWDRSKELMHRTEAICAAMIEAWGYTELLQEIRKFYLWLLSKDEFKELAASGKAPYIAETALRKLYTDVNTQESELQRYLEVLDFNHAENCCESVSLQSGEKTGEDLDAGKETKKNTISGKEDKSLDTQSVKNGKGTTSSGNKDKDINVGSKGKVVPRLQKITRKMNLPMVGGKIILNLDHLLEYKPNQVDLFNTRATKTQFTSWYNAVKAEYGLEDEQMGVVMNGFMVWCIDNGTSPDVNGMWVMMDGEEQVEYPLKPIVENARPTLRQIMHHFSDAAEAYIEMRNSEGPYMPSYGLLRNLRDRDLARYAFDFYEVTSKTPNRAREALAQMKAAALTGVNNKLFGLDGNISTNAENTERHTARDVNQNMHTLLGMGPPQ
uniref:Genome polyprotein n=2 Tax=Calla lily latent virus TaxID=243560 RepID=D2CGL9_9POTV|nr:polyprotein [Calla lily latent virus]